MFNNKINIAYSLFFYKWYSVKDIIKCFQSVNIKIVASFDTIKWLRIILIELLFN